jgi:hypothetical protein
MTVIKEVTQAEICKKINIHKCQCKNVFALVWFVLDQLLRRRVYSKLNSRLPEMLVFKRDACFFH